MADIPEHLLDKRIIERNIHRGAVNRKDFDKHLKELPDAGDNAESVQLEESREPAAESDGEPIRSDGSSN